MHDFFLAKQILENILEIAEEKKLSKVSKVSLEIGSIVLAHDDLPEHLEDINVENLVFGLISFSKDTLLAGTQFDVKKVAGNNWKIVDIEVE
jgi:Zn finger protein HypA/HybF involved in hydrogenase expression